jgi:hypothetical protein
MSQESGRQPCQRIKRNQAVDFRTDFNSIVIKHLYRFQRILKVFVEQEEPELQSDCRADFTWVVLRPAGPSGFQDTLYCSGIIALIRNDYIRKLMMDLSAAPALQPADLQRFPAAIVTVEDTLPAACYL